MIVIPLAALMVSCNSGGGAEVPGVEAAPTRATSTQRHRTPVTATKPAGTATKPAPDDETPSEPHPGPTLTRRCDIEIGGVCAEPTHSPCHGASAAGCLKDALAREVTSLQSEGTEAATAKLTQLAALPAETEEAISALSEYEWNSPSAKDLYDRTRAVNGF